MGEFYFGDDLHRVSIVKSEPVSALLAVRSELPLKTKQDNHLAKCTRLRDSSLDFTASLWAKKNLRAAEVFNGANPQGPVLHFGDNCLAEIRT